jgi:hypothetical protein
MEEMIAQDRPPVEADLQRFCLLANQAAYDLQGVRNSCILTSCALVEFLRLQGLQAQVFRAEAHAHCRHAAHGAAVGWNGDGTRRPKSDGWHGHLAVTCGNYVLDPTLDQLDPGGIPVSPAVFLKPDGYDTTPPRWQQRVWHEWTEGDCTIRHARHWKQFGWKSKPAARESKWRDLVALMIELASPEDFDRLVAGGAVELIEEM